METPTDFRKELAETAQKICSPGKGILAADESTGTIGKRFSGIDVENTEPNRKAYRTMLFETPTLENYISGVILYSETVDQSNAEGKNLVELLNDKGIVAGIKLDKGMRAIAGTDGEFHTQGFDNLGATAAEFYAKGVRFAKWRCALKIGNGKPSELAINLMAQGLARYASICQANGLVPIVEPEVLIDGDHDIAACQEATFRANSALFKALQDHHVFLEGCLLKPNMVTPGIDHPDRKGFPCQEIAARTITAFLRTVPAALPGIVFLSGGQSEQEATRNLNQINKQPKRPWALTFSFGRALQHSVLKTWLGKTENVKAAQDALIVRAKANSEAQLGVHVSEGGDGESLVVKNYIY